MRNEFLESRINMSWQLVASVLGPEELPHACLYHAVALAHFLKAPVCAGSASWRFVVVDNGRNPTHFSHVFDDKAAQHADLILTGGTLNKFHLPEMHAWNYWQGKILDISTRWVPMAAQKHGFLFDNQLRPPAYLWNEPIHRNKKWLYVPDKRATVFARTMSDTILKKLMNKL